jgi:hypothetical protein
LIALFSVPQLLAQHVSVKNDMIDVGQIKFQNAASADFEIKNVSNKAIYIRELLTSCGCVVGDYPQEIIRRDSSFVVRLTYDAMQLGHFEKYASIYFNDDTEPTILTLKGVVVEEIVNFEGNYPYKLGELFVDKVNIEFDDVSRGERPFAEIHVKNPTSNTVQPVVMHLPNFLTADMSPSSSNTSPSAVMYVFTFSCPPCWLLKRMTMSLSPSRWSAAPILSATSEGADRR